jgi:ectoine hydroxylase-related dioxygenase (phytanoyl-CoA dioxygenase family)
LFFDSRVWHATGQNVTEVPRHVVLTYFNRSFMRTQENYFLSLLPAVQRNLSPRIKTMLGFKCTGSLGGVEGPIEGLMVERPSNPIGEMEPKTQ